MVFLPILGFPRRIVFVLSLFLIWYQSMISTKPLDNTTLDGNQIEETTVGINVVIDAIDEWFCCLHTTPTNTIPSPFLSSVSPCASMCHHRSSTDRCKGPLNRSIQFRSIGQSFSATLSLHPQPMMSPTSRSMCSHLIPFSHNHL